MPNILYLCPYYSNLIENNIKSEIDSSFIAFSPNKKKFDINYLNNFRYSSVNIIKSLFQ